MIILNGQGEESVLLGIELLIYVIKMLIKYNKIYIIFRFGRQEHPEIAKTTPKPQNSIESYLVESATNSLQEQQNKIIGKLHNNIVQLATCFLRETYPVPITHQFLTIFIDNFRTIFDTKYLDEMFVPAFAYKLWNMLQNDEYLLYLYIYIREDNQVSKGALGLWILLIRDFSRAIKQFMIFDEGGYHYDLYTQGFEL